MCTLKEEIKSREWMQEHICCLVGLAAHRIASVSGGPKYGGPPDYGLRDPELSPFLSNTKPQHSGRNHLLAGSAFVVEDQCMR